jgi:hypothetical protein
MIEKMTSNMWKARGSSVVFGKQLLGPLLHDAAIVSMRQAMAWAKGTWPPKEQMPKTRGGKEPTTIIVVGLDIILEGQPVNAAEEFLRTRLRRLIQAWQDQREWPVMGLVFGMNASPKLFTIDYEERVIYRRETDGEDILLSPKIWNGAASRDLFEIVVKDSQTNREEAGGYYVRRLS